MAGCLDTFSNHSVHAFCCKKTVGNINEMYVYIRDIRPNKKILVFPVTRPSVIFFPEIADSNLFFFNFQKKKKIYLPTDPTIVFHETCIL